MIEILIPIGEAFAASIVATLIILHALHAKEDDFEEEDDDEH